MFKVVLRLALLSQVALLSAFPARAHAASPMRLIETADGTRWMSSQDVEALARRMHAEGRCGGFMDITNHPLPARPVPQMWSLAERAPAQFDTVNRVLPKMRASRILKTVKHLSSFENRFYNNDLGEAAALWIRDEFIKLKGDRDDITVELFNHEFRQPSVIARIAGKPSHADEKVIIGAHEDSINWQYGGMGIGDDAPGADDNASGVATIMEAFRGLVAADYHPTRTVEFITYAGEELGLLGSQDIAEAYQQANQKVVGVMQFDMTMFPADSRKITLITDFVDKPLTIFAGRLIDTYLKIPWQKSQCSYACSDHASWNKAGFPAVFPFETAFDDSNPSIHSERDTIDAGLDAKFALSFAKLSAAFAIELAEP